MKILETDRLYLRRLTTEDAKRLYYLNLDRDVIKYTGDKPFKNIEEAKLFLTNYDHYTKYDFGRWAVINKINSDFLGWCGLKYTPELKEIDIGFRFFKNEWNKGYATESGKACVKLGFEKFKISEIVGRVMIENTRSIRVLEKIGLTYNKQFNFDGHEGLFYKVDNKN
jgi:RimJ/RimL family protein N-acetyltransferase